MGHPYMGHPSAVRAREVRVSLMSDANLHSVIPSSRAGKHGMKHSDP